MCKSGIQRKECPFVLQGTQRFPLCSVCSLLSSLSPQCAHMPGCIEQYIPMYSPKESTANSLQAGIPSWPVDMSINDQFACHPHKSPPKISQPRTGGSGFQARVCGDSSEPCRRVSPEKGQATVQHQSPNKSLPQQGMALDTLTPWLNQFGTPMSR